MTLNNENLNNLYKLFQNAMSGSVHTYVLTSSPDIWIKNGVSRNQQAYIIYWIIYIVTSSPAGI